MSNFPKVSELGSGHLSPEAIMMYELFARVGNSTDGQAYQRVREVDETKLIDIVGADIYIGVAIPGTLTSESNWKISRINTNNPISIFWADSSTLYNKKFDDRATYTYA
jgi:hypothetical protein